jgi:hypothetical protein
MPITTSSNADNRKAKLSGPAHALHLLTEQIGASAEQRRPGDATERVHQQEMRPGHPVRPGQQRREGAQEGDEPPEEYDLPAVTKEEILADLQPLLGYPAYFPYRASSRCPSKRPTR